MLHPTSRAVKSFAAIAGFAAIGVCSQYVAKSVAQSGQPHPRALADSGEAVPIYGVKIPAGYRDWRLITVGHETANLNEIRAQLGNDLAMKAYREGTLPFPDGSIVVALHWKYVPSDVNNKALGQVQSFVAGDATNMQVMVKDSKKYAATGGWGFADFTGSKPASEAVMERCWPCHSTNKENDYVFARYAPH